MASNELPAEQIPDYLAASMDISGSAFENRASGITRALRWFRHLQGFGYDAIPFFAVHDVGHLLHLADAFPFRAVTDLDKWSEEERPLRLAYENRFLNMLRSDARVRRLMQLIAQQRDEEPKADSRIERSLEILFAPVREDRLPENFTINPAQLRDATAEMEEFDAPASTARFSAAHPGGLAALLGSFVTRHAARIDLSRLLREEDFFELQHFEALDRPHRRLFARKVQELVTSAEAIDVARTGVKVESQEAATLVQDEGTYPTGGIGEITTSGSIENLVKSELMYMITDEAKPGEPEPVDLFALRWAEGDLLFYTRDSGALHRKRRTLVFLVEPGKLRVKDPRHANARSVLAYSLIARAFEDLLELFGGEGARAELRIIASKAGEADQEEAALFGLRLREAVRRGDAEITVGPLPDAAALVDPRRRTFVVAVGDVVLDEEALIHQGGTLIRVELSPIPQVPPDADSPSLHLFLDPARKDPAEAIGAVRDDLLARVIGIR